jgi:hypothetical protein
VNKSKARLEFRSGSIIHPESSGDMFNLSDEQLLICFHKLPGYCLANKEWGRFDMDYIEEIDFNTSAFENLVLSQDKKTMVASLVQSFRGAGAAFDDFVDGKGKGLIFLLYGPPGVGKTFTAGKDPPSNRTRNVTNHWLQKVLLSSRNAHCIPSALAISFKPAKVWKKASL